jgi:hypothetical protein
MNFNDKLISLILAETKGKSLRPGLKAGKLAEVIEALAAQLGTVIALHSGGDAKTMNTFLEGASSHMFECAAEKQKFGQFIAQFGGRTSSST